MAPRFLTDADRAVLRRLIADDRQKRTNSPNRTYVDEENFQAPEVYIAYPQDADGIPAMTPSSGTGTGDHDVAGQAECDIYRLIINEEGEAEIQEVEGLSKTVYNLSTSAVPQQFISIIRTKYGKWLAVISGDSFGCGILQGPLAVATDIRVGATSAQVTKLVTDPENPGDLMDGPTVTVTNRDPTLSGDSGDLVHWKVLNNENLIDYIQCQESSTGTGTAS